METFNARGEPVFSLGHVQFSLTSPLVSLACCDNTLVLTLAGHPRTRPPQLIHINLDRPANVNTIDLPIPPATAPGAASAIVNTFVDPSARHVIVSTTTGDSFYVFIGQPPPGAQAAAARRPKLLSRLKGSVITAVSWAPSQLPQPSSSSGPSAAYAYSTREILLGTAQGQIFETVLHDPALSDSSGSFSLSGIPGRTTTPERYVRHLYTLLDRTAVTGLRSEVWGGTSSSNGGRRGAVIATTEARIYQFVGFAGATAKKSAQRSEGEETIFFDGVFRDYFAGDVAPKILELPGDLPSSELHFFSPARPPTPRANASLLSLPTSVAWLTSPGIYSGSLTFPTSSPNDSLQPGDGVISQPSLVPFPSPPTVPGNMFSTFSDPTSKGGKRPERDVPISMTLTEWHFVLLYADRIKIVEKLTDKIVHEEALNLGAGDAPLRVAADPVRKTYWVYSKQAIFELVAKDEDRDVSSIFLGRGNFSKALEFAKTKKEKDYVLSAEADSFFASGRFIQAAQCYAKSSKPFEEVVLGFIDKEERDALRLYLIAKLDRLRKSDTVQRILLSTWLVEIYLSKINQLDDLKAGEEAKATEMVENFNVEITLLEDELKEFLKTYKDTLDPRSVYELIISHGRDDVLLHYAGLIADHSRIIEHYISREEWKSALAALAKQDDLALYYQFAPVLVRRAPRETTDAFTRRSELDVRRLIPALVVPVRSSASGSMHSASSAKVEQSALSDSVTRYLEHVVTKQGNTDAFIHNMLLALLATDPSTPEARLVEFLATVAPDNPTTGLPYYDLDYGLRQCRNNGRLQGCALICAKMGLYEESVDLALESDDLELAKLNADRPPEEDELLRKKLWLKVAKHVVGKKHDIKTAMEFLESTDLLKIEDILPFFPDFVVIDDFKDEICSALEGYSARIEKLKHEMDEATRNAEAIETDITELRNRFVIVDAAEKCAICTLPLLTRQFYVFPCQHTFHADCLITEVTKNLTPTALRRMLNLQSQLAPARRRKPTHQDSLLPLPQNEGLRLAAASVQYSVQGLDQLRKLVLPDALLGVIGGAIPGTKSSRSEARKSEAEKAMAAKEEDEKRALREQLDEMLASSCVLCDGSISNLDRPFVDEGEPEM